jgi:hypothetical protein
VRCPESYVVTVGFDRYRYALRDIEPEQYAGAHSCRMNALLSSHRDESAEIAGCLLLRLPFTSLFAVRSCCRHICCCSCLLSMIDIKQTASNSNCKSCKKCASIALTMSPLLYMPGHIPGLSKTPAPDIYLATLSSVRLLVNYELSCFIMNHSLNGAIHRMAQHQTGRTAQYQLVRESQDRVFTFIQQSELSMTE